jgi:periplasmic copper chaperone A
MIKRRLAFLLLATLPFTVVHASQAQHVHASHAWIRVLPGNLPAGAYVTLQNDSFHPVALNSASSAAYKQVMLHQSTSEGGMSRMSMVEVLSIPGRGQTVLAPSGYHLMLMQPLKPVQPGDTVKLTLKFSDGSTLDQDFIARPANAIDDTH